MEREGGNKEKVRKGREWISPHFLFNFSFSLYFLAARLPQHVHPWLLKLDIEASVSDMQYIAVVVLMSRLPRENLFFWALPELGREDPVLKLNLTLFQKWKFAQLGLQGGGGGGESWQCPKEYVFFFWEVFPMVNQVVSLPLMYQNIAES